MAVVPDDKCRAFLSTAQVWSLSQQVKAHRNRRGLGPQSPKSYAPVRVYSPDVIVTDKSGHVDLVTLCKLRVCYQMTEKV
jgi:hypothetical protein